MNLTVAERELFDRLPRPPSTAQVTISNVWIVDWLSDEDRPTGHQLHEWLNQQRQGWAHHVVCKSKAAVLDAIAEATERAAKDGMRPVLHIEAHGMDDRSGLCGPGGNGGEVGLSWDELTAPIQALNVATLCNLVLVAAACHGIGAILTLVRGPRVAAAAILGPDANVSEAELLESVKELYRRQLDPNAGLSEMAGSASREMTGALFEVESSALLSHEAFMHQQIVSLRPDVRQARLARLRKRLSSETRLVPEEIEMRISSRALVDPAEGLQKLWDYLFMIDLAESNRARFGVDMTEVRRMLLEFATASRAS